MKNLANGQGEILLKPDVRIWIRPWLICAGLLILTQIIRSEIGSSWFYWISNTVWSAGLFVTTIQLLPGSAFLRLNNEGFTIQAFFKKRFVRWDDCSKFKVWSQPMLHRKLDYVVYSTKRKLPWGKLGMRMAGGNEALTATYGMDAESLCDLMNERRQKFIDDQKTNTPC